MNKNKLIKPIKDTIQAKATLFFFGYFIPSIAFASGTNMFTTVLYGALDLFTNYIARMIIVLDVVCVCILFFQGKLSKSMMLTHVIGGAAILSASFIASAVFKV